MERDWEGSTLQVLGCDLTDEMLPAWDEPEEVVGVNGGMIETDAAGDA
jgi:hypothetical protein